MGLQFKVVYKKGIHNGADDALSRKPPHSSHVFAVSTVQPTWLTAVQASYVEDDFAQSTLQKLALDPKAVEHYTLSNGILRYQGRIWVGNDLSLQEQIVSAFHESP